MLIGVSDPAIVFFFERVLRRIRIRVAPQPELLDELFAFFVGLQSQERTALFRRNDVNDVFLKPFLVRRRQLFLESSIAPLAVLFGLLGRSRRFVVGSSLSRSLLVIG